MTNVMDTFLAAYMYIAVQSMYFVCTMYVKGCSEAEEY